MREPIEGQKFQHHWSEVVCTVVLALSGLASTWCAYQASLWGGRQSVSYAMAAAHRAESTKAATRGGQESQVDVALFVAWSEAHVTGNQVLEHYLQRRFRKEFRPTFEEWFAMNPKDAERSEDMEGTPFALPSYQVANNTKAVELAEKAVSAFNDGEYARLQGHQLMRSTVILALAMFFGGIALQFRLLSLRLVMVVMSVGLDCLGLYTALSIPRLQPERPGEPPQAPAPPAKRAPETAAREKFSLPQSPPRHTRRNRSKRIHLRNHYAAMMVVIENPEAYFPRARNHSAPNSRGRP